MLIDIEVCLHYLEKIDNNIVCNVVENVEDLLQNVLTFIVIANLDFCDVKFCRSSLLSRKCFRFNDKTLNFFKMLRLCQSFANAIDVSVFIKKIFSSILFCVDKYQ